MNKMNGSEDVIMIYCNGDSYSDESYCNGAMIESTYDYALAQMISGGYNINHAISGSCNRRILRTSIADLYQQRQLNPTQQIIALIGLTFDLRSEIWNNGFFTDTKFGFAMKRTELDSDFISYQMISKTDWVERLNNNEQIAEKQELDKTLMPKYFDMLTKSYGYFYSPTAQYINLYMDLIGFAKIMDSLDVEFLVFHCPSQPSPDSDIFCDALLNLFAEVIHNDDRFIGFSEGFSFCQYLEDNGFASLGDNEPSGIKHFGKDGHKFFAETILYPKLAI